MTRTPLRVLLADDHVMVRAGLARLLESIPTVTVVGEACDGYEVLDMARALTPDLVFMDVAMPRLNGLEACAELIKRQPDTRVVILSMHREQQFVRKALQCGAVGYLLKDSAPDELQAAIDAIARNESYLSPTLAQGMLHDIRTNAADAKPLASLTARQTEVLALVAQGLSNKEVARQLSLSVKTVDTHRTNLMSQLDIHDVTGLVRYAIRTGLVTPDH